MTGSEPSHRSVRYPGGVLARYGWVGSGHAADLFALTEAGGPLVDHGRLAGPEPDALCRAEMRVEGPGGTWTVRLASAIFDEPEAILWDTAGLLVVRYGFATYALASRTGELRWHIVMGTPLVALLASSRLDHVLLQGEIETRAVRADGSVAWRVAHADVITDATLVGGRLVLTAFSGAASALDPVSGRDA